MTPCHQTRRPAPRPVTTPVAWRAALALLCSVVIALVLCATTVAAQTPHLTYIVSVKSVGHSFSPQTCEVARAEQVNASTDALKVIVKNERGGPTDSPAELAVFLDSKQIGSVSVNARSATIQASSETPLAGKGLTLVQAQDQAKICETSLARPAEAPSATTTTSGGSGPSTTTTTSVNLPTPSEESVALQGDFDAIDVAALKYLQDSLKVGAHGRHRAHGVREYEVYLLPSGRVAPWPLPDRISEQDRVTLHVVRRLGDAHAFDLRFCGGPTSDRTLSHPVTLKPSDLFKIASEDLPSLKEGSGPAAGPTFFIETHAGLQCADSLSFVAGSWLRDDKNQPLADTTHSSLRIDRVYRFVWGVAGAYDFGRPERWSLADRPDATGKATEKFVSVSNASAAPRLFLTLGVHWCGTNPAEAQPFRERLRCDLWSPTLGFDVGNPLKRFALALSPISAYGVNLLVGATLAQSDRLRPGVNDGKAADQQVRAGATWNAPGGLPTEPVYNKKSVGFLIGMSTTAETVASWHLP